MQQANRTSHIRQIYASIDKCMRADMNVDEEKLIAEAQFGFGSARRTIMEYLKVLEVCGSIVREDGKIWTKEGYQAELILRKSGQTRVYNIPPQYFEQQTNLKEIIKHD